MIGKVRYGFWVACMAIVLLLSISGGDSAYAQSVRSRATYSNSSDLSKSIYEDVVIVPQARRAP
jgi:hypothetical protein